MPTWSCRSALRLRLTALSRTTHGVCSASGKRLLLLVTQNQGGRCSPNWASNVAERITSLAPRFLLNWQTRIQLLLALPIVSLVHMGCSYRKWNSRLKRRHLKPDVFLALSLIAGEGDYPCKSLLGTSTLSVPVKSGFSLGSLPSSLTCSACRRPRLLTTPFPGLTSRRWAIMSRSLANGPTMG